MIPRSARRTSVEQSWSKLFLKRHIAFSTSEWYAVSQNSPLGLDAYRVSFKILFASATIAPGLVLASFASLIAAATGLLSIPTVPIPSMRAAKFVVPLPQNGSITHSFDVARRARMLSGKSRGNIVK